MLSEEELLEARHKLAAGRILASRKMPYFTTVLMAMSPHEREGLGTFAVDERWRMYYDPAKCLEWDVQEIAAVWLHEVGHIIRDHSGRYKALEGYNHDPQLFNAAGDAAINSDLRESGVLLPNPERRYYAEPNPEFPKWKKGMTAEEMYFIGRGKGQGKPPEQEKLQPGNNDTQETEDTESTEDTQDTSNSEDTPNSSEQDEENSSNEEQDSSDDSEMGESEASREEDPNDEDSSQESSDGTSEPSSEGKNTEEESEDDSEGESGSESPTGQSEDESEEGSESGSLPNFDGPDDENDRNESDDDGESEDSNGNPSSESDESGESEESGESKAGESNESADSSEEDSDSGNGTPQLPDCGSAVDGEPRDYEETDDNDGSIDKTSADALKKKTAEEILDYAKSNPGSVPGNLVREAENILDPQVDWRDEFAALIRHVAATHAGYTNYSYNRPSRRSAGTNFILPTMRNPPAPEIAVVLDTSGSMDEKRELALGLAEMEDIINRSARYSQSQSVKIINCDSAAATVEVVRDLKDFQIIGGGGTDMRVGIQAASEIKPKIDIVITITDGYTPWPSVIPEENPRAFYIALIVGAERHARSNTTRNFNVPEWMKVIEVNIPQKRRGSRY